MDFKQCNLCHERWQDRESFLHDPSIKLIGYKADLETLELGLFFFNHIRPGCLTTLAIETAAFLDMYSGTRYTEIKTGGPECPGFCLHIDELQPCPAHCRNASVREIIALIRKDQLRRV